MFTGSLTATLLYRPGGKDLIDDSPRQSSYKIVFIFLLTNGSDFANILCRKNRRMHEAQMFP